MNIRDFKGLTDWVEVFKGGKQTDSQGRTHTFSEAELDQIVANHDPDHPVPHVITHKEFYSPFAYAQGKQLKREGNSLFVKSDKVEPQFEKLIKDGRLYERSVRLLKTDNGFKLGHIAWLGAEPPAVEGLAPVEMSREGDGVYDFEMPKWILPDTVGRFMRGIRDWFIDRFDTETADRVVPNYMVDEINDLANQWRNPPEPDSSYSRNDGGSTVPLTEADIEKARREERERAQAEFQQQQNTELENERKQFEAERAKWQRKEYETFVTEQVDAGKLLPSQAEGAVEFMMALGSGDEAQFEFSRGTGKDAKTEKADPVEWFQNFCKSLGKQIELGDRGGDDKDFDASSADDIVTRAREYQAERAKVGVEITDAEAVRHVTQGAKQS